MRIVSILTFCFFISLISCKKEGHIQDIVPEFPDLNGVSLIYSSNQAGHNELACLNDLGVQVMDSSIFYDYWWAKVSPDQTKVLYYRSPANPDQNHDDYHMADLMIADLNGTNPSVLIPHGAFDWNAQGVC